MDNILEIKNLKASVTETEEKILNGLNLSIGKGETHAIMGPNGGGKSTLVNVCLLYTSPSPRDTAISRMPSSA